MPIIEGPHGPVSGTKAATAHLSPLTTVRKPTSAAIVVQSKPIPVRR